jgi:hypothetical protein
MRASSTSLKPARKKGRMAHPLARHPAGKGASGSLTRHRRRVFDMSRTRNSLNEARQEEIGQE